ncbi:hypothetical protein [Rhodoferax saidenbachensis]|uniref:hypothetical protein n=1 Tax=Rhodoferax saidenbachensis TaxID=1484693 RepID=UPI0012694655|nr:hypothetical protein [Rhodoferax saidenbachensis]
MADDSNELQFATMKTLHRTLFVALALPFVAAGLVAACWARSVYQENAFYAIPERASRASVVTTLGTPDVVRKCGENLWWGDDTKYRGPNDGRCVTEERYENILTAYGVGYSADGHVVSKYRYVSE